eukprot:scaffold15239_cov117-Skeletonema_menzelii.AAC.1
MGTKWSNELFANIQPVKLPILEQSFALFDGGFASHFFGQVLTEEYVHQRSDYWLDYLWCQVAFGWDEARPGCLLVPVVIVHHNTRQLSENSSASANRVYLTEEGFAIRHLFSDHPTFGKLLELSHKWGMLVGWQHLEMIEERCNEEEDGNDDGGSLQPFNLEACTASDVDELAITPNQASSGHLYEAVAPSDGASSLFDVSHLRRLMLRKRCTSYEGLCLSCSEAQFEKVRSSFISW